MLFSRVIEVCFLRCESFHEKRRCDPESLSLCVQFEPSCWPGQQCWKDYPEAGFDGSIAYRLTLANFSMKEKQSKSVSAIKAECDFRNVKPYQIEACCHYEYFRESAVMRKTLVLPTCTDQIARSALTFVLNKTGWMDAAENNEAPPPWNSLDVEIKQEVSRCVRRCVELEINTRAGIGLC
jgi:hypothetical protein